MRLTEIEQILKENIDNLLVISNPVSGTANHRVSNLFTLRHSLNQIAETGLFKPELAAIKNLSIYPSVLDQMVVSSSENLQLTSLVETIRNGVNSLIDSINIAIPNVDNENIISIKLPNVLNFDSLSKIIDLLKKSLALPLHDSEVNDNIEIKAFESGSFWIDILVHSLEAVNLIAAITWSGAYIYRQSLEGKKHIQYSESLKIKNEHLKDLQEATKKQLDLLTETEAKNLQNDFYNSEDNEKTARLILAIKSMSELIEKGTEIHPSLLASDNTSKMFPSFKNLNLIESKTKQISKE